jgi:hypothetical protein
VGLSHEAKRAVGDVAFTMLMTMIGSYFGAQVTEKNPSKGVIIGGAAGFFLSVLKKQVAATDRVADQLKMLRSDQTDMRP